MKPRVHGLDVDGRTGCAHWRSAVDIVAIRMKCCGEYYACKDCHEALAGHPIEVWPREGRETLAVMCGACGGEMTIAAYLAAPDACPACGAGFNPGCRSHHRFYFAP
ncbi:MAG TPA: CHY zinc finger protein [Caulobacteraceae bacterium]